MEFNKGPELQAAGGCQRFWLHGVGGQLPSNQAQPFKPSASSHACLRSQDFAHYTGLCSCRLRGGGDREGWALRVETTVLSVDRRLTAYENYDVFSADRVDEFKVVSVPG
jgi:hypothetical protein